MNSRIDPNGQPGRIFLVDQHVLVRRAAAGWINHCSGLKVCGMAGSLARALTVLKRLRPDVVVSEILRPDSLDFIRELHRRYPRLPILVFSIQDKAVYGTQARAAGACGYLMKNAGGDKLVRCLRAILRRQTTAHNGRLVALPPGRDGQVRARPRGGNRPARGLPIRCGSASCQGGSGKG